MFPGDVWCRYIIEAYEGLGRSWNAGNNYPREVAEGIAEPGVLGVV